MDWDRAIERNTNGLRSVVATLFVLLEGAGERIPRMLHRSVLRLLIPAESAVRRLIVVATRGLVVKPSPARPMPPGHTIKKRDGNGVSERPALFKLFDKRKHFDFKPRRKYAKHGPRIWVASDENLLGDRITGIFIRDHRGVLVPRDRPAPPPPPAPPDTSLTKAGPLMRRALALKRALENIPREARRMARAMKRREEQFAQNPRPAKPIYVAPMRIGQPPGHRKKPVHEVDHILAECHWFAREALKPDTS